METEPVRAAVQLWHQTQHQNEAVCRTAAFAASCDITLYVQDRNCGVTFSDGFGRSITVGNSPHGRTPTAQCATPLPTSPVHSMEAPQQIPGRGDRVPGSYCVSMSDQRKGIAASAFRTRGSSPRSSVAIGTMRNRHKQLRTVMPSTHVL